MTDNEYCMCGVCLEERAASELEKENMSEINDPKALALAAHLSVEPDTIENEHGEYYTSTVEPGEYLVLTDAEADEMWDEFLENYIDECILYLLPEAYRNYFDREAWKRDAQHDGRGHSLSGYDGNEHEEKIDGVWYYIYRTN